MTRNIDTVPDTTVSEESAAALEHVTVENDDAPDECAIFPAEATDAELDTAWIVAQEGSFIDRESIR